NDRNDLKNIIIHWGGRWPEPGETGYTHQLYIDGVMHIFKNVDGDKFYYQGLLEYIMSDVVGINEAISHGSGIVVKTLCIGEIVDVCDGTSLHKMWHCSDVDSMWDVQFLCICSAYRSYAPTFNSTTRCSYDGTR
ncbi:hypothetical protein GIB67_023718, partial [Kingdonia uniflora]